MKKILTLLLSLCLSLCIVGLFTACNGNESSGSNDNDMIEVAPTTIDIGVEESLEVKRGEAFEVSIRLGWENWTHANNTVPDNAITWSTSSGNYVDAQFIDSDIQELDGWLVHFIRYSITLNNEGSTTLTAYARGQAGSDSITVNVIASDNNNSNNNGNNNNGNNANNNNGNSNSSLFCPEENLELKLVGDHYVVTGIGTYKLGSVALGTYYDEPNALNIYNSPNGIPITEIAEGAFSGLGITYFGSSTVTKIGDKAFENCTDLLSVIIEHDTTLEIGAYTFAGCANFEKVTSQATIKSIGDYAFAGLKSFNSWNSSAGVLQFNFKNNATIGAHAFEGCTSLVQLITNSDLNGLVVGEYAFANCTGLSSINSFMATEACAHSFEDCINIINSTPRTLTKIEDYAFAGCDSLRSVECDDTVEIGDYAFLAKDRVVNGNTVRNTMLGSVCLYGGATKIGVQAFKWNANLTSVESQGNIGTVCEEAFYGCKGMYEFSVEGSVDEVQRNAFSNCGSQLDEFYINRGYKYMKYHVTEGTRVLRSGAFSNAYLSELDITKTEVIEGNRLAFAGEVRLTLPSHYTEIPDGMFEGCSGLYGITFTSDITRIGVGAFAGCPLSDSDFMIPNSVARIEERAFYNCSLTNGELPVALTYIGANAFFGNKNFVNTTVYLPASLTEICESAFAQSSLTKLVAVEPMDSNFNYPNTTVWNKVFQNCRALQEIDFTAWSRSEAGFSVANNMFDGCSTLTTVKLGYVKYIGVEAFKGCIALESFEATPTNDSGEYYENTATGFYLGTNGQQPLLITLEMLADAEAMAANIKNGMYDSYGWNAWEV